MFLLQTEEVSEEFMLLCALSNLVFSSLIDLKPKNWLRKKLLKLISYKKKDTNFRLWRKFQGPQESIGYKTKINHLEFLLGP